MKNYLQDVIIKTENNVCLETMPKTQKAIGKAKEILEDPKFIAQKGIRSFIDKDTRVGYKSQTDSFYGYKIEFTIIPEERIITAVSANSGSYVDVSKASGLTIKEVYGDKAYFRKAILETLKKDSVDPIIPVNCCIYKIDEDRFTYNKDSDQWFCEMGNQTVKKVSVKSKKKIGAYRYHFDKSQCTGCPKLQECAGKTAKKKVLHVGQNSGQYYEHSQYAKASEFKLKYRKRASHEWKNGERKRFHGLDRARGYGLKSMDLQAKFTALAVNLKRIAALAASFLYDFYEVLAENAILVCSSLQRCG